MGDRRIDRLEAAIKQKVSTEGLSWGEKKVHEKLQAEMLRDVDNVMLDEKVTLPWIEAKIFELYNAYDDPNFRRKMLELCLQHVKIKLQAMESLRRETIPYDKKVQIILQVVKKHLGEAAAAQIDEKQIKKIIDESEFE